MQADAPPGAASGDFPLQYVATFAQDPGVAGSDHLSFWRKRDRAMVITGTAFYRYPYYTPRGTRLTGWTTTGSPAC